MSAGKFCNRDVVVVRKGNTIPEAAELMRNYHVGALVVVEDRDGQAAPIGILTDRDIVVEIIAKNLSLDAFTVGDVMSFDLLTAREDESINDTLRRMRQKGVRRVPVVNAQGALVGILTVDDLLEMLAGEFMELFRIVSREMAREQETKP